MSRLQALMIYLIVLGAILLFTLTSCGFRA